MLSEGLQPFNLIPIATNFLLKMVVIFFEFRVDESGFTAKKIVAFFRQKYKSPYIQGAVINHRKLA